MLLFDALERFPSFPPLPRPQWHFLSEDEYVQHLPPSLSLSLSLSASRSQPISLCLSLCHSQPITGWLQVLNPRPHHQLAHYIAALNLPPVPSSSLFLFPSLSLLSVYLFPPHTFFYQPCFWCIYISTVIYRVMFPYIPPSVSPLPPSSFPFLAPSFCKLLQLNCPFPACRLWWY